MSEPVAAVNMEDDGPALETPPPAPPVAVAPPEPPPAEPEIDPDTADLTDERQRAGLLGEIKRLRQENRTLKPEAAKAAELSQAVQQMQPYVQFLQANPQLLERKAAPEPPPAPTDDPDAREAAEFMSFYSADGKLDLEKGRKWLDFQDRRSGNVAQKAVEPLAQSRTEAMAHANYQQLLGLKLADGTPVRKEVVDNLWRRAVAEPNGLKALADPQTAAAFALMVLGAEAGSRKPSPPAPEREPIFTEASGGTPHAPVRLSAIESEITRQRGVKAEDWAGLTKNFTKGRSNVVEE